MDRQPTVVSSRSIYKNPYTEVVVDTLNHEGKRWEQVYLTKPHKRGVGILPIDDTGIYLVRQYRHPIRTFLWQIPMGMIDPEKTEEETARNELREEAGLEAETFTRLGSIFAEPGVIDQEEVFYVAEHLRPVEPLPAENEIGMRAKHFLWAEINTMIHRGELQCGFTLSALHLLKNRFPVPYLG